jgi:uncharacterized protein YkwD
MQLLFALASLRLIAEQSTSQVPMRSIAATVLAAVTLAACVAVPLPRSGGPAIAAFGDWPTRANCQTPAGAAAATGDILARVNAERIAAGLRPVRADPRTGAAAQKHACDIAATGALSHVGSDGSSLTARLGREGVLGVAAVENTGLGYPSSAATVAGWLASPGHRANIFNPGMTRFGAGLADTPSGRPLWVLVMVQ